MMESTSALPSKILSSSLDPVVTWIISSRCAWSWLALVNPRGTIFDAAKDLQTGIASIVCKHNTIFIQPRLKTINSLIVLTCFNYLVNFSFTYSFDLQKVFPWSVSHSLHSVETRIFELFHIQCSYSRCLGNKLHRDLVSKQQCYF